MAKTKYDFVALKSEFFLSEILEVKPFLEMRLKAYTQYLQENTAGWTKEKKEWKRKIAEQVAKETMEDRQRSYQTALNNLVGTIAVDVSTKETLKKMSAQERQTYWRIMMTMTGQPTLITKNENSDPTAQKTLEAIHEANTLKRQQMLEEEEKRRANG